MIINGTKVEGAPKEVQVTVAGKELKLSLVHISKEEKADAKFTWVEAPEGITLESTKAGNRVATTIKAAGKVVFENLTAQSTFQVLNAKFGWTTGKADSVYKKSNPLRKESQAKKGATTVVIKEQGTF